MTVQIRAPKKGLNLRRQLKLREVKVNGARVSADCPVRPGDTVAYGGRTFLVDHED